MICIHNVFLFLLCIVVDLFTKFTDIESSHFVCPLYYSLRIFHLSELVSVILVICLCLLFRGSCLVSQTVVLSLYFISFNEIVFVIFWLFVIETVCLLYKIVVLFNLCWFFRGLVCIPSNSGSSTIYFFIEWNGICYFDYL